MSMRITDVLHNTEPSGGSPPVPTPAPAPVPVTSGPLTQAQIIDASVFDSGMNTPAYPAGQPVAAADPPAALPNTPPAETPIPGVPTARVDDLTPRQAAIKMLESQNPETQKMGKELLDRLFTAETKVEARGPEIPAEPDWKTREADVAKEVTNWFREKSAKMATEDGVPVLDKDGKPVYEYTDPDQWMVEVETERRLERERNQFQSKVTEIKSKAESELAVEQGRKQWDSMMGDTVQATLLSHLFENVEAARATTPDGKQGVKRAEFQKHEKLAKALAKSVAEELNYDEPRFSGPAGMSNVMQEIGARVGSLLSQYIPKSAGAPAGAPPITAPRNPVPTPVGAPSQPVYTPPVPSGQPVPYDRMGVREKANLSLNDRMASAFGGNLPSVQR